MSEREREKERKRWEHFVFGLLRSCSSNNMLSDDADHSGHSTAARPPPRSNQCNTAVRMRVSVSCCSEEKLRSEE